MAREILKLNRALPRQSPRGGKEAARWANGPSLGQYSLASMMVKNPDGLLGSHCRVPCWGRSSLWDDHTVCLIASWSASFGVAIGH